MSAGLGRRDVYSVGSDERRGEIDGDMMDYGSKLDSVERQERESQWYILCPRRSSFNASNAKLRCIHSCPT